MKRKNGLLFLAMMLIFGIFVTSSQANTDWGPYATLLQKYVDKRGWVNYKGLKTELNALKQFNASLADATPGTTDSEKIAFYINAYNAFTLQAVVEKYPVKSIKDIPGVWEEKRWKLAGKTLSLNDIEHQILRKQFNEPRIHMGLVCASVGCPGLRAEPYSGSNLPEQLNQQTELFLAQDRNFHFDGKTVYLSSIFDWFGDDFVKNYGNAKAFSEYENPKRAVLNFVHDRLSQDKAKKLWSAQWELKFTNYDWSLNSQK